MGLRRWFAHVVQLGSAIQHQLRKCLSWEATVYIENHGCTEEATFNYDSPADPVAVVEDQYQFCTGLTFDFVNLSENAEVYIWDFGDGQGGLPAGTSTDPNPTYTFPDTGVYIITLSAGADFSCPDYATAEVEIQFLLEPEFVAPTPDCFEDHYFSMEGVASVDENTVYDGTSEEVAFADIDGEVVNGLIYAEPGTYEVSLTASVPGLTGCLERSALRSPPSPSPPSNSEAGPTSGAPAFGQLHQLEHHRNAHHLHVALWGRQHVQRPQHQPPVHLGRHVPDHLGNGNWRVLPTQFGIGRRRGD